MGRPRRLALSSVLLVIGWLVGALVGWGGSRAAEYASDVSLTALAAVASVSLGRAARRRPQGRRLPLVLLSAACALWALGEALWSWYALVLAADVPFPSVADVAYLAATGAAGGGLLALSQGSRQRSQRARSALDGWLVAGSLLSVSWVFVLGPVVHQAGGGVLAVLVAVAYPVMDVMLATVALLVVRQGAREQRRSIALVVAALLAMTAADSAFTGLELLGRYRSGGVVDLGWVLGYLLLAHAGWADDPRGADASADEPAGKVAVQLPYLLVACAIAVVAFGATLGIRLGAVEVGLLASLVLALIVRQGLTATDNAVLASQLALREKHYRSLVQGAQDVIVLCDRNLRATYASPSSLPVLGLTPERIVGHLFWELVHPDDVQGVRAELSQMLEGGRTDDPVLLRCRMAEGRGWLDTESTVGDLRDDPDVAGIVISTRDVSERIALESQLRTLAWHDPLTGLANRTLLRQRLEHALSQRRPGSAAVGLLLMDLDRFKGVNDTYGHATGDALLVEVAKRLISGVRHGDTVARLGGDEFAVLLEVYGGDDDSTLAGLEVAERLLAALGRPFVVGGRELLVGASIGLALASTGSATEDLMRQADFAMYASKDGGRGRVTVFGAELAAVSSRRAELARDFAAALAEGELYLDYQPLVDLASGVATGAEALARWRHPVWGEVPPTEFVTVAESTGFIAELGRWALVTAARQAARWEAEGLPLGMAVNVSVRQLGADFVHEVAHVLAQTALTPHRLTLEITESLLVDDEPTLASLTALRGLGVKLALDDFGTGWSSLAYLRRLPVDILKLDRSFVAGLGTPQADAVSHTVVQLARELGLEVIAEGVETPAQRDLLVAMGCQMAQGFLFGTPGPAQRVQASLPPGIRLPRQRDALVPAGFRQGGRRTSM